MNALLITLELLDSILITGVGNGEENSSRTLPYIPGAALRGAFIARYKSGKTDLLDDEKANDLFNSNVRFLNGYPDIRKDGCRSLPVPASWRKQKGDPLSGSPVVDNAFQHDDDFSEVVGKFFCTNHLAENQSVVNDQFVCFSPDEELAIHIAGQNRGIVKRGENTLFQYQSIEKGQTFIAVIIAKDKKNLKEIQELIGVGDNLSLGRSRSAKYGRALIKKIQEKSDEDGGLEYRHGSLSDGISLVLLSDVLIKDEFGQPTQDLDGYLTRLLGKSTGIQAKKAFIRQGAIGGFNRKWELPLSQSPSIGMGSVFIYDANVFSEADLKILGEDGIGEKLVDGFGRLAINWPAVPKLTVKEPPKIKLPEIKALAPDSQALAKKMAERLLHKQLDSLLLSTSLTYRIDGAIASHQLSRIRNRLREVVNQKAKDTKQIRTFLDGMKSTAKTQFERARVVHNQEKGGPRLWNWLEDALQNQAGLPFDGIQLPVVAGQKANLGVELRTEYTLRFIEAVIDGKMKHNRKDGQA